MPEDVYEVDAGVEEAFHALKFKRLFKWFTIMIRDGLFEVEAKGDATETASDLCRFIESDEFSHRFILFDKNEERKDVKKFTDSKSVKSTIYLIAWLPAAYNAEKNVDNLNAFNDLDRRFPGVEKQVVNTLDDLRSILGAVDNSDDEGSDFDPDAL